ncbi:MAG: methionyl-tRNA formyltransferase [Gammaproteobacteria bacterium]
MTTPLRIAFAGTPDFAVAALDALVKAGREVIGVWTQPDRPAGRGRKLGASPVKRRALELQLPVYQPATLKTTEAQAQIKSAAPDVMIVAAYGLLLPNAVLGMPQYGCINIHASLLPRWRGAAPIQRAILTGDAETGITLMQMARGLDTGDILDMRRITIHDDDTAQTLHDRLAILGAEALLKLLAQLPDVQPVPQDDAQATYAEKLTREEAVIDWALPAEILARQVRGYNPWPVAHTHWQGEPLRIWRARMVSAPVAQAPGTILNTGHEGIDVATGKDALRIIELQAAGRRVMPAADFAHAHVLAGQRFG